MEFYSFNITDSTNEQAKRLMQQTGAKGLLVSAEEQTAGRGRRGRSWVSPGGTSLYFSIGLRTGIRPERISGLTLVMALAAAEAIEELTSVQVGIKWPNDLVIDGKKICGILTEMTLRGTEVDFIIIGVGVNVLTEEFPEELAKTAGSIRMQTGQSIDKEQLLRKIVERFETMYAVYEKTENLQGLKAGYEAHLINLGKEVRVLDPKGEYTGIAGGITESGELLVDDGEHIRTVYAGEVSVRGLYGYV